MNREKLFTVPNIISMLRMVLFPVTLYYIIVANEKLFGILIAISLVSDVVDGFIARRFHMETRLGAKLDSYADMGVFFLSFLAIYLFKWAEIGPYAWLFELYLLVTVMSYALVFAKFKGLVGLHTYMFKSTGYVQGAFLILLFNVGFNLWLYYICLSWGIVACIEEIIIISILKAPQSNVKGLYWILKANNNS